jgi:hypothetical protein
MERWILKRLNDVEVNRITLKSHIGLELWKLDDDDDDDDDDEFSNFCHREPE